MGNILGSLTSGFIKVVSDLFGAPLDFLSGKSCSSACGSTWDLLCYIENFCIANLLKLVAVLILLYIVLLFFYLLYKIGICHCLGKSICKMLWACFTSCFSACEYGCMFIWFKMKNLRRMKQENLRDMEEYDSSFSDDELEERLSYSRMPRTIEFRKSLSRRSRERRRIYLERSLRPRSHRIRVGISRGSIYVNERDRGKHDRHVSTVHNIKVTRTSKFVQKANGNRIHHRRW